MSSRSWQTWAVLASIIIVIIVIPFILFGDAIEAWTKDFITNSPRSSFTISLVFCMLLAFDILAPIPSSLVSTSAGYLLGFWGGTFTSWLGMTISCFLGYWLGLKSGRGLNRGIAGEESLLWLEIVRNRFGEWFIIISRPVPILAETAIFFAGISKMAFGRFLILTMISNLSLSVVYAYIGANSFKTNSILIAFTVAILLPGIIRLLLKIVTKIRVKGRETNL